MSPTCPVCGQSDLTARIVGPTDWHCGHCNSLFTGGDAEWERWAHRRAKRIDDRAKRRVV